MVKLIKRVKNGAFLYQNNACSQGTAHFKNFVSLRVSSRNVREEWRHYEHFRKLRDDWAIPAVTGLLRLFWSCQYNFCFIWHSTLITVTFLTSNQEPRSSSISVKISKSLFPSLFSLKFFNISKFFTISFQLSKTMYNFCVVLARWGIFVKNDKCLVWNSLIGRILNLRRPR